MNTLTPFGHNSLATIFLAQDSADYTAHAAGGGLMGGFTGILSLIVAVDVIIGMWKVFTKAGQPGWASLIPFFNFYVLCKIAGRPGWWLILMLIPFVNFIIWIVLSLDLAKSFGKGAGFGIALLSFIFLPVLGFGDASYQGAAAA